MLLKAYSFFYCGEMRRSTAKCRLNAGKLFPNVEERLKFIIYCLIINTFL